MSGKTRRKRKGGRLWGIAVRKMGRALGILLATAMVCGTLPAGGLTVSASDGGSGLCKHHRSHTEECGYQEAQPCTHEHGEECYKTVTGCVHTHTDECYPETDESAEQGNTAAPDTKNREPVNCAHVCSEESGCVTKGLDCHHEHDGSCGYVKAQKCGYVCEICNGTEPENTGEDTKNIGGGETESEKPEDTDTNLRAVEDLIAALPDKVTEDNADKVRAQLDEILALYRELTEEEQEQIDISRCLELQEALDKANAPATVEAGTSDLELFGQKVGSGDSGDGWSYADGVLTLEDFHCDDSSENFIHVTNASLEFTIYLKGDNSVKTSETLFYGNAFGSTTITGDQGASLSLEGRNWNDRNIYIRGINLDVTTWGMIFLSYDMVIDDATVNFNMDGSNGYIYTTHGGFTVQNGSDVTLNNSSGQVDCCVYTNGAEIADSTLHMTNPSGFGVYVAAISSQVTEHRASVAGSTISADVLDADIHCEDEMSVAGSQVTGSGRFLLRSKKAITVDDGSTMEGITYEFFKSGTGAAYRVYGDHTLASGLTVAANGSFVIPEGAALTIPDGVTLENNGTMRIHEKASLNGTGALTGNGKFLIDVNEDMITIPEGLTYTGQDYTDQITLEGKATVCGVEFTTDTEGWTRHIEPAVVKDAGEYTVTFAKGDKTISKTFRVAECPHTGLVYRPLAEGGHGGTCPLCNEKIAEEHKWAGGICSVCSVKAVAKAEKDGAVIGYYDAGSLADAFGGENSGAAVTLLDNVTAGQAVTIDSSNLTLDLNGHTYDVQFHDTAFIVRKPLTVMDSAGSGRVISAGVYCFDVYYGSLTITGGSFSGGESAVCVTGGTLRLTGGSFTGGQNAILVQNGDVKDALENYGDTEGPHYAFYQGGVPLKPTGSGLPAGTFTVQECRHTGVTPTPNKDGTHALSCPYCGYTEAGAKCTYGFSGTVGTCTACRDSVTVTVTGTKNPTYTGSPHTLDVTVTRDGTALAAGTDYTIAYTGNTDAGTAGVSVTIGDGQGTYTENFTIGQATPKITWGGASQELLYTGAPAAITAPKVTLVNGEEFGGTISYSYKKRGEMSDKDGLPTDAGTYTVKAHVNGAGNYTAADSTDILELTISYMDAPGLLYNNSSANKGYYNGDVTVTAVPADGHTYQISDAIGGNYEDSFTISAQQGAVTKTLYFKDEAGHLSDGVAVKVQFDLTPPAGKIAVGAKWWQKALGAITFGQYRAKEYTVTIHAEDTGGSGIDRIKYVIVTGSSQYTDVDALTSAVQESAWKEYTGGSRPTVDADKVQYVVYARLTDRAGNVTYISTEGILLDSTAPKVSVPTVPEDTRKDRTAGVTFTVDEAADYYYVVLPKDSAVPAPKDIIVTCGGRLPEGEIGTAVPGTVDAGKGAVSADTLPAGVSVEVKNLWPYTEYIFYVTAVDRALDITDSETGTPAGNIADVVRKEFITRKTLPVITKAPAVTGTYGQKAGEMTVADGTAQDGNTAVTGTWAVSDTDKDRTPDAGTAEKVTVIFTPDNAGYDSVSVQVPLNVDKRSLLAPDVTVSEVAGTYTYTGLEIRPPVEVNTAAPVEGISVSDGGAVLTANDFTVSYSNNKDAGMASVTITGKENYTGSVTKTFTIEKAPGRTIPDLTGSDTNNGQTYTYTITPTDGAVYRKGDDGEWTTPGAAAGNVFEGIKPGTSVTFYAKMPETENYKEGTEKSITVNFRKLTPAAPALSYIRKEDEATGKITLTIAEVTGAQYSFDGGVDWQDAWEQGGFDASQTVTLAIRLKGTDTHNSSAAQTVTIDLAKEDREAPPAFTLSVEANGETDYTVAIPSTEGCEYSFDGVTWSDVNVKIGIKAGETVTGYKRYKETGVCNAGSAVSAKAAMPKFTVKTPVISPAGGSYAGSISVTITCGSPDAVIYYTTDGSTPGRGSNRYTGAFTVSAPATVKAVAVKDGLNDSIVATASYMKQGSGSGSGGSGGGGNHGGSSGSGNGGKKGNGGGVSDNGNRNSGDGGNNPDNENTASQTPANPFADNSRGPGNETAPGTGTTPVNPNDKITVRPGSAPDRGTNVLTQGIEQPFIKGEDGKIGWNVIRAEEEQAEEGSIINVDMNGSTIVPGDIFDSIRGRDIIITFDMGNDILWSVDGKSIIADKAGDVDFSVQTGGDTVPVDIVNTVTGERYSIQLSLSYEGEFGFTAVLSIGLGKENAGYTASLYYYNEETEELVFVCADEVAEDGTASLTFTHASDYVIVIGGEEENGNVTEPAQPKDRDGHSAEPTEESPQAGQTWNTLWLIVGGVLAIAMGIGVFFVAKKKEEDENSGQ